MQFQEILKLAHSRGASDIHLVVGHPVIIRVAGELQTLPEILVYTETLEAWLDELLSPEQLILFKKEKDFDLGYGLAGIGRFRINLFWEKSQPSLAARLIPTEIPSWPSLNLDERFHNITKLMDGLVLVTGPTGCGKSTTMAAFIEDINKDRASNIITLEDPIEYLFVAEKSVIRQRQLNEDMVDFGSALKHVLRQDPNVIMVGEMRDLETIGATLTLAETGHLVLATLHTQGAAQTINRIIDVFPPYQQAQIKTQLSISLRAVISQRLLPRIGGGLVAIREFMIMNSAIGNLIREGKIEQIPTVMQTSADIGMMTIDQALDEAIRNGLITEGSALPYRQNVTTRQE